MNAIRTFSPAVRWFLVCALLFLPARNCVWGIGANAYVSTNAVRGGFPLVANGAAAGLYLDATDHVGVLRAADDLRADIARVTGFSPALSHDETSLPPRAIIAGTIGKCRIIDQLIRQGRLDTSGIAGQWESFLIQVLRKPLPGVDWGLVIAGSDKRGAIYGLYDLSEQIGVSPWYWWADVPVNHADALFVKPGARIQGPPAVKYRGIFLNDEAPCLTGWVNKNFGGYNHRFYTNVFELLLRLKANYLWPAMWNNCFNEDDPLNPILADQYGIVMGTSHVEPMMRADKEWNRLGHTEREWNYLTHSNLLDAFWKRGIKRSRPRENFITIAMRGKIDTPMSETANIALLEKIVAAQRQSIEDVYQTNASSVPQLWALYKEVQEYYEKGMRVPDDVTLLWCDDNWGNVRRLPTPDERQRSGGAGIYYHFDYVGGPRNYKWLNTVPIPKIWEQMNLAYQYGADRIWIVNVGDLKPMEVPVEFFLSLAWNPQRWPKEKLDEYMRLWAAREFGPAHAGAIAEIVSQYTQYNGWRKPELLEPNTFSLVHCREADRVLEQWQSAADRAERIFRELPGPARDAFFQLVLYPTRASAVVTELYITAGRNRLYADQGRASANDLAARVRQLFQQDADLAAYYNRTMAGGKWNHMMDQTHIGYTYWQQPPSNTMPSVTELAIPAEPQMGVAVEGSASAWPGAKEKAALPQFDVFNRQSRHIEVFNRGGTPYHFTASASAPWLLLTLDTNSIGGLVHPAPAPHANAGTPASIIHGTVHQEQRIHASVNWSKAPAGTAHGQIAITSAIGDPVVINVTAFNPRKPRRHALKGFVESEGLVSIEAEHYTRKIDAGPVRWEPIKNYGRTLSSMTVFPVTAASVSPPSQSPCLEYRISLFSTGKVDVTTIIAPSLNFVPGRGLRFAMSLDDETPQILTAVPKGYFVDNGNSDWEESVRDNCRRIKSTHTVNRPGYHTLKVWMVDPGIVLQKLVLDFGGVRPSYFGPPESYRH